MVTGESVCEDGQDRYEDAKREESKPKGRKVGWREVEGWMEGVMGV